MLNKTIHRISFFILLAALASACTKEEALPPQERLFRPVLKGTLESDGNYIDVSWEKMKGAINYTVQVSHDTFKTIDRSITIDSNKTTFLNLKWDQPYRLQVKANAPDSAQNSHWGYLGEIKTPKFPTILLTPLPADINATQVRVSWKREGAEVTNIKILNAADSSVAKDITLTPADVNAQFKVVDGLTPGSPYIIFLYSGTSLRGWANFSTNAQLSGTIIDLTQITDRPRVLLDTLPLIDAGATVLLKKGQVYAINAGLALTKAVTITSGDDLVITEPPTLYFTSNFGFASGANVDYIRFDKLKMRSDNYGSRYVFNVNTPCNVGEISFTNCIMGAFRGVTRFQDQIIVVGKYIVNNCMIDSVKDYGVLSVDGAKALVMEMKITNSTIYKTEKVLTSSKPTGTMTGIVVENCTFNQVPLGGAGTATGNALIDCNNQKFTGNIQFKNNIVGPGLLRENVIVRGIRPGLGSIEAANNYKTSDAIIAADGPIPDIIPYSGTSTDLFTSPATGNFKIKDNSFAGKSTAGDPYWRP